MAVEILKQFIIVSMKPGLGWVPQKAEMFRNCGSEYYWNIEYGDPYPRKIDADGVAKEWALAEGLAVRQSFPIG